MNDNRLMQIFRERVCDMIERASNKMCRCESENRLERSAVFEFVGHLSSNSNNQYSMYDDINRAAYNWNRLCLRALIAHSAARR